MRYASGRQAVYVSDFEYFVPHDAGPDRLEGAADEFVIEDVKGFDQPFGRLKRAIFEAETGLRIRIVR